MRICSFLPSATEMVYMLGRGDSLHGVSHECDYPPQAASKPLVVRSRIDSSAMSGDEIDRAVGELMMRGESVYEVDEAALADARPDLVITQRICEVCAVSFEDVESAVAKLPSVPRVVSLDPHSVGDVIDDALRLGRLMGAESAAHRAAFDMRGRVEAARRATRRAETRPRVACVEWLRPIIIAGHWIPEMVELAGGVDALATAGAPSVRIDMERLAAADPDVIVLMPCGMDVAAARAEFDAVADRDGWRDLRAVSEGRAYIVDSGAHFSRSGPRLIEGLETLARILHPALHPAPASAAAFARV